MAKDYYQILGVSKNASQDEIKRAYRKLAHEYHPDKNQAHADGAQFKEINEAYQVLSNPQKRAQYDQFGTVGGPSNWGDTSGFDFRDFGGFAAHSAQKGGFSFNFGGLGDIFDDFFGGVLSQVQTEVEISLTSALLGEKINLRTNQGENLILDIPPGAQEGTTFRFQGKGLPARNGRRGDLLVTIRVKLPKRLTREQKELLEELKRMGL